MPETKRIPYLDMARGIGMVLVVMGHVEYINLEIRQFITVFHMPLFFLLTGILLEKKQEEEKNYVDLIKKKAYTIMLPYAVFSVLSLVVEVTRMVIKGLDEWDEVFHHLFQSCCLQGVSTLWFLPALFMSELLFVGIRKRTDHVGTLISTVGILLLCNVLNTYEKAFYESHMASISYSLLHDVCSMAIRNIFCVVFICAGYYLNKIVLKYKGKWIFDVGCLLISAVIAYVSILASGRVELHFMYITPLPIYLIGAISGSMTVLFFCKLLQNIPLGFISNILCYYGRNSLIIMVTHLDFRILYISILISQKLLLFEQLDRLLCILIVFMVFVLEIPVIWFLNRYLPFALGKRKKSS